ncbi:MAG: hypothetical protein P9L91_02240 [Candidatus Zophobacter franzmannii]|nr:hypothetical protein [Candidatus Zophobacter franzmannii]
MNKKSFTTVLRISLIAIFLLLTIQSIFLIRTIDAEIKWEQKSIDLQNIIYVFIFIQFTLLLIIFFYIPYRIKTTLLSLERIIKNISKWAPTLDIVETQAATEKEMTDIMEVLDKMYNNIQKFDAQKKEKIYEQHSRISSLLKLAVNDYIILTMHGVVAYCSESLSERYPAIHSDVNVLETDFTPDIEKTVKAYYKEIVAAGHTIEEREEYLERLQKKLTMQNQIVRDASSVPIGVIIAIQEYVKEKKQVNTEK